MVTTADHQPVTADLLNALIDEIGEQLRAGQAVSLDDYCAAYPQCAEAIRDLWPTIEAMALAGAATDDQSAGSTPLPEALGDFRILREIGRGGMGVVYEAEQLSLGRRVALKIMPYAAMLDERTLARFRNEARAAATLFHPHIVPIFFVGAERGVHFYAMQLIEGASLAEVVAAMRKKSVVSGQLSVSKNAPASDYEQRTTDQSATDHELLTTDDSGKSQIPSPKSQIETEVLAALSTDHSTNPKRYFRRVAELGIQAAEALDHAHEHGVIHRDIKPGNLLLDNRGKLWVADFGLARIGADPSMTASGDIVGTLRYMSPEQLAPSRSAIDPRTDIYSLGITLYELAALRPAFPSEDRQELSQQIAATDPPGLRQVDSHIPLDLQTIIQKAIEKDPADRYGTATDLAADLRRFLQNEPVHAKPLSLLARTRKWSRRHQPILWSAVAALSVLFIVMSASLILLQEAYESERAQRTKAEEYARRADENADIARSAVGDIYEQVTLHWLADGQQPTTLQRKFLENALTIHQHLVGRPATTLADRRGHAETYFRMGNIHEHLRQFVQAQAAFEKSIDLYRQLLAGEPENPEHKVRLSLAYNNLSIIQVTLGDMAGQERSLALARHETEDLARRFPDVPEHQRDLLLNDLNRAGVLKESGRLADAEQLYRLARTRAAHVFADGTPRLPQSYWFASASLSLSELLRQQARHDEALIVCREGNDECRKLVNAFPDDRESQVVSAQLAGEMGEILLATGEFEEAESQMRRASELWKPMVLSFMKGRLFPEYIDLSTRQMLKLGEVLHRGGKEEEGEAKIRDAIDIADAFANDYPDFTEFQVMAANAWDQVANLYQEFHPAEVPAAFERAVAIRRQLVQRFPDRADYQGGLGGLLNDWANWLGRQERFRDARTLYVEAIEHQRNAIKLSPRTPKYRQYLRNHHANLLKLHVRSGDYRAATTAMVDMLRDFPDATEEAAQVYRQIAWQLAASSQSDELQAKQALASAKAAIELAPLDAAAWQVLGWAHYRNAQYQKAIEALNTSIELQGGGDPGQWLFLAMAHWKLNASPRAMNVEETPISAQADSGHGDEAREYYDSAVDWMGTNPRNDEFRRIRAEAEQLMGIIPRDGQPPEPMT